MGFFTGTNPANAANPYLNDIPGQMNSIYGPWINQGMNATQPYQQGGQWAGGQLQGQLGNLMNNPTGMFNQWGSTYQSSPGYNWEVGQSMMGVNNAAAAGGMAGSPEEQQNMASTVGNLANQNYWQYINEAGNLYGQGLQGAQNMYGIGAQTANNMYSTGANMAGQYGNALNTNLENQANLNYAGQINQNQMQQGLYGAIAQGVGGLFAGMGM